MHDREYRNERKKRKTRKEADEMLRKYVFEEFKVKNKEFLGWFVSNFMYYYLRIFGRCSWVK